jgi:histidinol phosphatase-like enzyme
MKHFSKAIFMDRDGTVSEEVGYMYHAGLYKPFPWTGEAVRKINESDYKAILITNQAGVGRGYFPDGPRIWTGSITAPTVRKCNATAANQSRV